ncbi:MAG: GSU2403 family nucleotidyltransferase fold protein [Bdellovibrionales bacterium]
MVYSDGDKSGSTRRRLVQELYDADIPYPMYGVGQLVACHGKLLQHDDALVIGTTAFQIYLAHAGIAVKDSYFAQTYDVDIAIRRYAPVANKRMRPRLSWDIAQRRYYNDYFSAQMDLLTPHFPKEPKGIVWLPDLNTYAFTMPWKSAPSFSFLLQESVSEVILLGDGLPVRVPEPIRFALHKLVCSVLPARRDYLLKPGKDRKQALTVLAQLDTSAISPALREEFRACGAPACRHLARAVEECEERDLLQADWLGALGSLTEGFTRKPRKIEPSFPRLCPAPGCASLAP